MLKIKPIEFKGHIFTLLVLYIKHDKIDIVKNSILEKINTAPDFFKNAPVVLNLAYLKNIIHWNAIKTAISSTGLHIIGVIDNISNNFKNVISNSGVPILKNNKNFHKDYSNLQKKNDTNNTFLESKMITQPVRSGQKIYVQRADLIIKNNVSAGAELIAEGNVHIYGTMRGRVLAGVHGDITKNIFCTNFFPELVSIAGEYLLIDQIPSIFLGKGVHVCLKKNNLFINKF